MQHHTQALLPTAWMFLLGWTKLTLCVFSMCVNKVNKPLCAYRHCHGQYSEQHLGHVSAQPCCMLIYCTAPRVLLSTAILHTFCMYSTKSVVQHRCIACSVCSTAPNVLFSTAVCTLSSQTRMPPSLTLIIRVCQPMLGTYWACPILLLKAACSNTINTK